MKFGAPNHAGGIHKGGRPRGARNRLASEFLEALLNDFREGGAAAIKVARIEDPVRSWSTVNLAICPMPT